MIWTPRLELRTVHLVEYRRLAANRADPGLWIDRGFANPYRHLIEDPGPLPHRIPRVEADPSSAPYLLRLAVHRSHRVVIGSAGFHDLPNADGMIEIGLGVVPAYRRQGYAVEILRGMWGWVVSQPGVRTLRYTVSPENVPSQRIIRSFGFAYVGQQMDEVDGVEDIFEMSADAVSALLASD